MIKILKGGCGTRHPSTYRMSRPEGVSNYILLIIKSPGEFVINNNSYIVNPGSAIILLPFTSCFYGNPDGYYIDDWLHFEISDISRVKINKIPSNKPFSIGNTDTMTYFIRQILWEKSYSPPEFMQQNIDSLFSLLMNHLSIATTGVKSDKTNTHFHNQLQLLRFELQNSLYENHTIDKCAQKLCISPSYFQHIYSSFFNIPFQKDLIQMRIENAKYVLTTTNLAIKEIADICGYTNEVHFYRQFKQMTGLTPSEYRKFTSSLI